MVKWWSLSWCNPVCGRVAKLPVDSANLNAPQRDEVLKSTSHPIEQSKHRNAEGCMNVACRDRPRLLGLVLTLLGAPVGVGGLPGRRRLRNGS